MHNKASFWMSHGGYSVSHHFSEDLRNTSRSRDQQGLKVVGATSSSGHGGEVANAGIRVSGEVATARISVGGKVATAWIRVDGEVATTYAEGCEIAAFRTGVGLGLNEAGYHIFIEPSSPDSSHRWMLM